LNIFFEIHKDLPREGPGGNEYTRKAFSMVGDLPSEPYILDIGCGPGMQTIELAKISNGHITALDNHKPFLEVLNRNIEQEGLSDKIKTVHGSMFSLDFPESTFDLIWSEGAIYIMGFEKGLKEWRHVLKKGGYIAVTECSWIKKNPPEEIKKFWNENYPGMNNIEENIRIIKNAGYSHINNFTLPEKAWMDNYYNPIKKRISALREIHAGNAEFMKYLDIEEEEIRLYETYSAFYSYVFYIMKSE